MADENKFVALNDILSQIDWDSVTAASNGGGFEDMPQGYYLCEVEKAVLKENKAQTNMQVSFQFKVIEDGVNEELDDKGFSVLKAVPGTKNRKIFRHYALKDVTSVKRFVSDMLKFEGEKPGEPILEKEYFTTQETMQDALDILVGLRIYINANYKEYNGQKSCWYDIVGWDRAKAMGLPL
jgi:hypothetical protein